MCKVHSCTESRRLVFSPPPDPTPKWGRLTKRATVDFRSVTLHSQSRSQTVSGAAQIAISWHFVRSPALVGFVLSTCKELVEHVARPDEVEEVPAMHTKDGGLLRQVQRATWERAGQILARPRSATRRGKMQVLERRAKVRRVARRFKPSTLLCVALRVLLLAALMKANCRPVAAASSAIRAVALDALDERLLTIPTWEPTACTRPVPRPSAETLHRSSVTDITAPFRNVRNGSAPNAFGERAERVAFAVPDHTGLSNHLSAGRGAGLCLCLSGCAHAPS